MQNLFLVLQIFKEKINGKQIKKNTKIAAKTMCSNVFKFTSYVVHSILESSWTPINTVNRNRCIRKWFVTYGLHSLLILKTRLMIAYFWLIFDWHLLWKILYGTMIQNFDSLWIKIINEYWFSFFFFFLTLLFIVFQSQDELLTNGESSKAGSLSPPDLALQRCTHNGDYVIPTHCYNQHSGGYHTLGRQGTVTGVPQNFVSNFAGRSIEAWCLVCWLVSFSIDCTSYGLSHGWSVCLSYCWLVCLSLGIPVLGLCRKHKKYKKDIIVRVITATCFFILQRVQWSYFHSLNVFSMKSSLLE